MNEKYIVEVILPFSSRGIVFIGKYNLSREQILDAALDYLSSEERKSYYKINIIQGGDWIPEE